MAEMSPLEMAKTILEIENRGMHVDEIASKIIEGGLAPGVVQADLVKRINAALATAVKRSDSVFARVSNPKDRRKSLRGQYRLKRVSKAAPPLPMVDPEPTAVSAFVGRAGEYAVMSELLFLGLNVSLMTVDQGIDVVAATPAGKYFHIQVKTSKSKDGNFQASIRRKSFENADSGQTFYVFVLRNEARSDGRNDYLVIPSAQIAIFIGTGIIKGQDTINLRFSFDARAKKVTLNNNQDVSIFLNKWAMIR